MSLRWRLLLLCAVALLPALLVVGVQEFELRSARTEEVRDAVLRQTQQASSELGGIVDGIQTLLEAIAASPTVQAFNEPPCAAYLARIGRGRLFIRSLGVLDLDGTLRCAGGSVSAGVSYADRSYFMEVKRTGRFTIGSYTKSRTNPGVAILPFALPLRTDTGAITGIVVASLDLQHLNHVVADWALAAGGALTIADSTGTILARKPLPEHFVGTRIPAPFQPWVHAAASGIEQVRSQDGTDRLLAYKPVDVAPVGFYVSSGLATDEAFAPLDQASRRSVLIMLFGIAATLAAAILAGERFVRRPVSALLVRAGAWRSGTPGTLPSPPSGQEFERLAAALDDMGATLQEREAAAQDESRILETLNRTGAALGAELNLERLVQMVTDAGVELSGARFGAYFHNVMDETGERLHLYTLSGADRSEFEQMGRPRATAVFGPTFRNEGVIRSDDILADPRYGRSEPHRGMPLGHLPVRSYLAVPVVSRSGAVLGGLLFGHPEPGRFTGRHERLMVGVAAQAAVAIDNAHLTERLGRQVSERTRERDRIWALSPVLKTVGAVGGAIMAVNPSWIQALGWAEDDTIGRTIMDFVSPEDSTTVLADLDHLAAGVPVREVQSVMKTKDGGHRVVSWTTVAEDGRLYGFGRDVTEQRAAEDALRQSQKMEAVGQLTGGIAHDFNNLLTVVRSGVDLLRKPTLTEERRTRYLEAIGEAAARGSKLTTQLLAFARRQTLKPEIFNVAHNLSSVDEVLGTLVGARVSIRSEVSDAPCFVNADPTQFDTALVNMAVNARDAMDEEGVLTISVAPIATMPPSQARQQTPGPYVAISVTDTGSGIAAENLGKIFEPFFTTKEVGKGTGLGLSQVFGFVKQSGGEVTVRSEVGRGTTFTLYLPQVDPPPAPARPAPHEAEPVVGASILRVLLVEDDPVLGSFALQSLGDLGYDAVLAPDAAHALAELDREAGRFDIVFSDVVMPDMSGIELFHEVRRRHPDLPMVLTSGFSRVLADEGAHGFELLQKPYSVEQLSRVLRKAARRGVRPTAASAPPLQRASSESQAGSAA